MYLIGKNLHFKGNKLSEKKTNKVKSQSQGNSTFVIFKLCTSNLT